MATSNLSGLFGDVTRTARDYDQQQLEGMLVSPAQIGAQGAGARAASLMGNRGAMTGVALNRLLGGKTSEEVRNSRINDALQKVSQGGYATEYEKMTALAQELGNMGMGAEAEKAAERSAVLKEREFVSDERTRKAAAEEAALVQQQVLVNAIVKQNPEIPLAAAQSIAQDPKAVRDLFSPQTAKAKTEFEKTMDAAGITDPAERQRLAGRHLANKLKAGQGDSTAVKALELMGKQLDIQLKQQKLQKGEDAEAAQELAAAKKAVNDSVKATGVLNTVDKAISQVGGSTSGIVGAVTQRIPGTEATDLKANLETIKANLGFDALQAMRDASPTGGALGQVAIQELVALQSTIASLDQNQSPEQLRENLRKIKYHYQRWEDTINGVNPNKEETPDKITPSAEDAALINKYSKRGK